MNRILLLAICGATIAMDPVGAFSAEGSKRVGFAVFGGYQTYSMSDVKEAIETPGTLFPGATASADEIHGGASFGAGLRLRPSERISLALDVSHLLAKTSGSGVFLGTAYNGELNVPATNVNVTLIYLFPSVGRLQFGLGAGAGYYVCTGEASATASGLTFSTDVDGSGFGAHAEGISDIALVGPLHAEIGAGYRYAKTTDVEAEGTILRNADGSKSQVDWSGFMGRTGLTIYLGGGPRAQAGSP